MIDRKGSVAVLAAAAAIVLLVFSINAANSVQRGDTTFMRMQAANETALRTENLVRILDRATAEYYYNHNDSACNPIINLDAFRTALGDVNTAFVVKANMEGCTLQIASAAGNPVEVSGNLTCKTLAGEQEFSETRTLNFSKKVENDGGQCIVKDTISRCTEYPAFSCP